MQNKYICITGSIAETKHTTGVKIARDERKEDKPGNFTYWVC